MLRRGAASLLRAAGAARGFAAEAAAGKPPAPVAAAGELNRDFRSARVIPASTADYVLDGNLFHQRKLRTGVLVGVDGFNNKYYENMDYQWQRSRFVDYADSWDYDASSVPPEWHNWLCYISDDIPAGQATGQASTGTNTSVLAYSRPFFVTQHRVNPTGSAEIYQPKGSYLNPKPRNWRKYESWTPA